MASVFLFEVCPDSLDIVEISLARFAPERFKWLLLNIEREDLTAIGNFFSRNERQKTSARSEVRDLHRAINIHCLYEIIWFGKFLHRFKEERLRPSGRPI